MSTHKSIGKICCVITAFALVLTVVFMNAGSLGVQAVFKENGYAARLFDPGMVHTIEIVMEDWEEFLKTCRNEEYALCSVMIDGEACKEVGIRAKGNTSLTQVEHYGNDRYSFKIEFDHYDSSKSYYGLDKLSLNNIIQDHTYMKDYLTYQMMGYMGADAPLCSYAYITVNGEDWGLYLAIEGVEEAFLERNYGNDYGELYKPDSQSMGGGRGNGNLFDMDQWNPEEDWMSNATDGNLPEPGENQSFGEFEGSPSEMPEAPDRNSMNGGWQNQEEGGKLDGIGEMSPEMGEGRRANDAGQSPPDFPENQNAQEQGEYLPDFPENRNMQEQGEHLPDFPENQNVQEQNLPDFAENEDPGQQGGFQPREIGNGKQMGGSGEQGMNSEDVSLLYIDEEYDSYQNIFDNAKTEITDADKDRLIASLRQLNAYENMEEIVDVDEVIRYFVVHNFVCNFDSYTGSMIHNYYLYEKDGRFSMIPWDYNLAFGGFQGNADASALVNYPIDTPVSGGTVDSRPMLAWIFSEEKYTELYHQYFAEFLSTYFDSGYFIEMIEDTQEMISPYVEKDPTKFCTYEEFETGMDTLKEFCLLRAESIKGQLAGTIASVSGEQEQQKDTWVDASHLYLSDMGGMEGMGRSLFIPCRALRCTATGQ